MIPNCTEITFIGCQVKKILIRVYHLGCHYFFVPFPRWTPRNGPLPNFEIISCIFGIWKFEIQFSYFFYELCPDLSNTYGII